MKYANVQISRFFNQESICSQIHDSPEPLCQGISIDGEAQINHELPQIQHEGFLVATLCKSGKAERSSMTEVKSQLSKK
ncbi:MAG: hypothetical protein IJS97_03025 [Prevotella sp.]|nr:hypothetical protein [Prevotella sp.]